MYVWGMYGRTCARLGGGRLGCVRTRVHIYGVCADICGVCTDACARMGVVCGHVHICGVCADASTCLGGGVDVCGVCGRVYILLYLVVPLLVHR